MKMSPGLELFVGATALFLMAPIVVVVLVSFSGDGSYALPPTALSLQWYEEFFHSELFVGAFILSLTIGIIVAISSTILGSLVAVGVTRFGLGAEAVIEAVFLTPLLVPHILFGAALLLFFMSSPIRGSLLPLVIGHVIIALPYSVRTIVSGLAGLGPALEQAAMSLGATPWQAFRKVTIPLVRSSLFASAIFAFVISFSDINVAIFLTGPKTVTLPAVIFSDVAQLGEPTVAAASTLQVTFIAAVLFFFRKQVRQRFIT